MGLPVVLIIILIGRGGSLPNAWDGIRLYIGTWHTSKLASGQIWTAALGQVFFSTGIGFGYFTAYASYQTKYSNAVQDAVIICLSNSAFEVFAAFAVFGVVGFLGLNPDESEPLGTFVVAFYTYVRKTPSPTR
jgi:solute carrier family 6 (neurotransmitter transporter, GABA) member 1